MQSDFKIIHEDRHLVAVVKAARLPTASDASGDRTLLSLVRDWNAERQVEGRKGYCVPIHFLDRPVSGLVVFALSSKAAGRLNEQFRNRSLKKLYYAIVEGCPAAPEGQLVHHLKKDKGENFVSIVPPSDSEGKRCLLHYRVLETRKGLSWVEVLPETGRSHQIRVQLASLGTPIYGDKKYGAKHGWDGRIALHAAELTIKHPVGAERLPLRAPIDAAWKDIWPGAFPVDGYEDKK